MHSHTSLSSKYELKNPKCKFEDFGEHFCTSMSKFNLPCLLSVSLWQKKCFLEIFQIDFSLYLWYFKKDLFQTSNRLKERRNLKTSTNYKLSFQPTTDHEKYFPIYFYIFSNTFCHLHGNQCLEKGDLVFTIPLDRSHSIRVVQMRKDILSYNFVNFEIPIRFLYPTIMEMILQSQNWHDYFSSVINS